MSAFVQTNTLKQSQLSVPRRAGCMHIQQNLKLCRNTNLQSCRFTIYVSCKHRVTTCAAAEQVVYTIIILTIMIYATHPQLLKHSAERAVVRAASSTILLQRLVKIAHCYPYFMLLASPSEKASFCRTLVRF